MEVKGEQGVCPNCGKPVIGKTYCNHSCRASYLNRGVRRHGKPPRKCDRCGRETRNPKYCSIECKLAQEHDEWILRWLGGLESGIRKPSGISEHIRRWLFDKYGRKCQKCGWAKVNKTTGKVPLTINHVDGKWRNNHPDNLELLCPNCHSLTSTYGALNKGNEGRKKSRRRKGD